MLLRASGEKSGRSYDLASVTSGSASGSVSSSGGVEQGTLLGQLAEALVAADWPHLAQLRDQAEVELGTQALVDVLAVIAGFYSITRIADSTGIPLDEPTRANTEALRDRNGINAFQYERKSTLYPQI